MSDTFNIKIGNDPENIYDAYPTNNEFQKRGGGSGGWPSDLPKPSNGGYGYNTTVKRDISFSVPGIGFNPDEDPWDFVSYSDGEIEIPEVLKVGKKYSVTINGVTNDYTCFEDDFGGFCVGYKHPQGIGFWQCYTYKEPGSSEAYMGFGAIGNVGEIYDFSISVEQEIDVPIDGRYMPKGYGYITNDVLSVGTDIQVDGMVDINSFNIIDGEKYKVAINDEIYESFGFDDQITNFNGTVGGSEYIFNIFPSEGTMNLFKYVSSSTLADEDILIDEDNDVTFWELERETMLIPGKKYRVKIGDQLFENLEAFVDPDEGPYVGDPELLEYPFMYNGYYIVLLNSVFSSEDEIHILASGAGYTNIDFIVNFSITGPKVIPFSKDLIEGLPELSEYEYGRIMMWDGYEWFDTPIERAIQSYMVTRRGTGLNSIRPTHNIDGTDAAGQYSVTLGAGCKSGGLTRPSKLGISGDAYAAYSEGVSTFAQAGASHAEGYYTVASGLYSHAEGGDTEASGNSSHAEGYGTKASGQQSHAEGNKTKASNYYSHAEGASTEASGNTSHAEGSGTEASGNTSHAEGSDTIASGQYTHAEGYKTKATGDYSHAEGSNTEASGKFSHVMGKCNLVDTTNKYALIIGNGSSVLNRSNCLMVDWDGAIYVQAADDATKMMKITVNSNGTISATQVTA